MFFILQAQWDLTVCFERVLSSPRAGAPSADPPLSLSLTALSDFCWVLGSSKFASNVPTSLMILPKSRSSPGCLRPCSFPPCPLLLVYLGSWFLYFLLCHTTSQPGFLLDLTRPSPQPALCGPFSTLTCHGRLHVPSGHDLD